MRTVIKWNHDNTKVKEDPFGLYIFLTKLIPILIGKTKTQWAEIVPGRCWYLVGARRTVGPSAPGNLSAAPGDPLTVPSSLHLLQFLQLLQSVPAPPCTSFSSCTSCTYLHLPAYNCTSLRIPSHSCTSLHLMHLFTPLPPCNSCTTFLQIPPYSCRFLQNPADS